MEAAGTLKIAAGLTAPKPKAPEPRASALPPAQAPENVSQEDYPEQAREGVRKGLKEFIDSADNRLSLSYHEPTGRIVAKIVNQKSGEVVREIPPEEILKLMTKVDEAIGVLFDKTL